MSQSTKLQYGQGELSSLIALYQSYLTDVESNLITENQMIEKGSNFLQWVNELLESKMTAINQISQRSIEVFKQLSTQEIQISARMLQLEHECAQKSTIIENHIYTIKNMENKLTQRDNDIFKMKQQIHDLTEKIQKQEYRFKRQTKEFKKTFRIIQENTESEKQIFDSIQLEYEYQKHQKDQLRDQLQLLKEQFTVVKKQLDENKRLLKASENKLQWEMKKKISLEEAIKEKNQMIEKLLLEINDLKQMLKDPYHEIDEDHQEDKYVQDTPHNLKSLEKKNLLSEEMARQSFLSQMDMDDDYARRSFFRKSFDEGSVHPSETNCDYIQNGDNHLENNNIKKSQSMHENLREQKNQLKSNQSSFYQQTNVQKQENFTKVNHHEKASKLSPDTIFIRDPSKTPKAEEGSSLSDSSQKTTQQPSSPQIHHFNPNTQKKNELQIITQKVQSENNAFRRYVPDLYFAHFLLTSQSVKIKEDCEEMLNVDVKQYYNEIIEKRIPMHIWDDWVRDKLRTAVKGIKRNNQEQNRRSSQMIKN